MHDQITTRATLKVHCEGFSAPCTPRVTFRYTGRWQRWARSADVCSGPPLENGRATWLCRLQTKPTFSTAHWSFRAAWNQILADWKWRSADINFEESSFGRFFKFIMLADLWCLCSVMTDGWTESQFRSRSGTTDMTLKLIYSFSWQFVCVGFRKIPKFWVISGSRSASNTDVTQKPTNRVFRHLLFEYDFGS